ncbi:MAG: Glyoxalase [uncultured Thiotrichaceae bacterium]|uniref:Glyoxalase n=1 Tax=uncultured Thiotrichaceae bacterium TaxID=298394 RepID=A0A6S6TY03_9GAMM|nr:MAG: Glyoxalase [uncultured Thiotrichaceae bacterium]
MEILHIHHVSFIVKNLEKALSFYTGILNLQCSPDRPKMAYPGAWLNIGESQQIHLLELENPDSVDNRPIHGGKDRHAAFLIRDFSNLIERLDQHKRTYTLSHSGRHALFTRDYDGNTLEFIAWKG